MFLNLKLYRDKKIREIREKPKDMNYWLKV